MAGGECLTPRMGSSGACARAAKTEDPCDAMVGNDSRVVVVKAESAAAAAVLRGEEGIRCRASVLNLRSALGCCGCACAARTLAGAIRCAATVRGACSRLARGGGTESTVQRVGVGNGLRDPGCGRRVSYKTAGAARGVTWTAGFRGRALEAAPWRRVTACGAGAVCCRREYAWVPGRPGRI
jgi:hypothetical protein